MKRSGLRPCDRPKLTADQPDQAALVQVEGLGRLTRNVGHVDAVVFAHLLYALTHPRAYELLSAPAPDIDAEALLAERAAIGTTLAQYARDELRRKRTKAQVDAATPEGMARIAAIDELLHANVTDDPLAAVVNAPDPVQAWAVLGLADQRLFIDRVCAVTILPSGRRGRGFDPTTVDISPKHTLGRGPLPGQALPAAA